MAEYEIRVTAVEDKSNFATTEYHDNLEDEEEMDGGEAQSIIEVVERALRIPAGELLFKNGDEIIHIQEASEESGFYYTRYQSMKDYENENDTDGGLCTGTLSDAIEMAIN